MLSKPRQRGVQIGRAQRSAGANRVQMGLIELAQTALVDLHDGLIERAQYQRRIIAVQQAQATEQATETLHRTGKTWRARRTGIEQNGDLAQFFWAALQTWSDACQHQVLVAQTAGSSGRRQLEVALRGVVVFHQPDGLEPGPLARSGRYAELLDLGQTAQRQPVGLVGLAQLVAVGQDDLFDAARRDGEDPCPKRIASLLLEQRRILFSM